MEQLVREYLVESPEGTGLDCFLFHELGVDIVEHRRLFEDWFLSGRTPSMASAYPERGICFEGGKQQNGRVQTSVSSTAQPGTSTGATTVGQRTSDRSPDKITSELTESKVSNPVAQSSSASNLQPSRNPESIPNLPDSVDSFVPWLWDIDGTGDLLEYINMFEQSYDAPEQVVRLYVEEVRGVRTWSAQFFDDVGIRPEHRPVFERWLATEGRARAPGGVASKDLKPTPAAATGLPWCHSGGIAAPQRNGSAESPGHTRASPAEASSVRAMPPGFEVCD